jgi:chromosome segregation ATPase
LEANLHGHIEELQKKLQVRNVDYELLETKLSDKIKELRNVTEAHGAKLRAVIKRNLDIRELSEKLEKTYGEKKETESALHDQWEDYERKLQEKDAESKKVRHALIGMYNGLEEQLEGSNRTKRTLEFILNIRDEELHFCRNRIGRLTL